MYGRVLIEGCDAELHIDTIHGVAVDIHLLGNVIVGNENALVKMIMGVTVDQILLTRYPAHSSVIDIYESIASRNNNK